MSKPVAVLGDRIFVGVPEVAEILHSDQRTVRRALEAGQIPGFKVGVNWRIPVEWLRKQAGRDVA
jgi:excisionase family DNA binding protein